MHPSLTIRRRDLWLTPTSVARKLGVRVPTLDGLVDQSDLPAYRYADRIIRIRTGGLG